MSKLQIVYSKHYIRSCLIAFGLTLSPLLTSGFASPIEVEATKALAEIALAKINHQLKSSFQITYLNDRLPSERCNPYAEVIGPVLCDDFFETIVKQFKPDEREAAMAYVIGHEIIHVYRQRGHAKLTQIQAQLSEDLNLDPAVLSRILYTLDHQNVDWGAIKVMNANGYDSIEPGIEYLQLLSGLTRGKDSKSNPADKVAVRVSEVRLAKMRSAFHEGLSDTKTYVKTTGFCAPLFDRDRPPNLESRSIHDLSFSGFLKRNFKNLPLELSTDCGEYSYEVVKETVRSFAYALSR